MENSPPLFYVAHCTECDVFFLVPGNEYYSGSVAEEPRTSICPSCAKPAQVKYKSVPVT